MPTLADIRQQYPQYNDMPDGTLADALYSKFYSDLPRDEFNSKIGLKSEPGFMDRLGKLWENPPPGPSIIGAVKSAADFITNAGRVGGHPGLRREDFTDIPANPGPSQTGIGSALGLRASGFGSQPNDALAEMGVAGAGVIGSGTLFGAPAGVFASGAARPVPTTRVPSSAASLPLLEAAERQGVPLPEFLASEDMLTQRLAAGLKNVPGAGDTIVKATRQTVDSLGDATKRVEQGFGAGSAEVAGGSAKDAIAGWIGEGSKDVSRRVYGAVDGLVNPEVRRPLTSTRSAVAEIMADRANAKIPGASPAVQLVTDAVSDAAGMNYAGVKDLRTFLGDLTPEEMVAKGVSRGEANRLYSALTQDLRATIQEGGGPAALKAFEKANTVHAQIMGRKQDLAKVIGAKGDASPEAVFSRLTAMAGSKSSADMGKLMQARKAMGSEAWDEVASGVVSRLGRDPQGNFSPDRFFTAYGNLSEGGRNLLFSTSGKDNLAKALNDINMIVNAHKEKIGQFSNPSGTAQNLIGAGLFAQLFSDPTFLLKSFAGLAGGNIMASALSKPASAKAVANLVRAAQRVRKDRGPAALAALQAAQRELLVSIGQGAVAETE